MWASRNSSCSVFRLALIIAAFVVLTGFAGIVLGEPAGVGHNLVTNPSFEKKAEGSPLPESWSGDPEVYSIDTKTSRTGKASLKFVNADPNRYRIATKRIPLQPGWKCRFSAWVKTDEITGQDSGATVCLEWHGKDGKWMGGSYPRGIKGTRDWTRIEGVARVPNDAGSVILVCYVLDGMTGTAWFDDAEVVRIANSSMKTGTLADGQRISGPAIWDWDTSGAILKLNGHPLPGPRNPVRWLRDDTLTVAQTPKAFVEMISGDCLPGTLLGASLDREQSANVAIPAHLVVRPSVRLRDSDGHALHEVRVLARMVRRIMWQRIPQGRCLPGTLLRRNGQRIAFRGHRFLRAAVQLLAESAVTEVPLDEIAELHLPQIDPWKTYYEELAALAPDLGVRLFQIETSSGLIATSSTTRFQLVTYSDSAGPNSWYHLIQPAWSLDAFAVPHREIHLHRYFTADEVPLSRIAPVWAKNRSALHAGLRWQVNRNVNGRPLQNGEDAFGWGFGVHGRSELKFPLPSTARGFRTRMKLDRAVADGGCVRTVVTLSAGGPEEDIARYKTLRELYRSKVFIGSKTVLDSGDMPLPAAGENQARLLTLAVDPVNVGRPKGADPLDIRDTLNWLEPVVLLDKKTLAAEVRRSGARAIPAWKGWTLEGAEKAPLPLVGRGNAMAGAWSW